VCMKKSCLLGFIFLTFISSAIPAAGLKAPERGFVSTRPAENWEEALISGNGTIGALVMSRPLDETIIFSHERLFMPVDPSQPVVNMAPHLDTVRGKIDGGRYREAAEFVSELARKQGYRGMRWTDPLIPAFDLKVTMNPAGKMRGYGRSVDFQTGVAFVRWEDERGVFLRRLFVSRADKIAVLSLRGERKGAVDCKITLKTTLEGAEGEDEEEGISFGEGVEKVTIEARDSLLTYRSLFAKRRPDSIAGYEGAVNVTARGGSLETLKDAIVVKGADEVLIFLRLDVLDDAGNSGLGDMKKRLAALDADFDELLARHAPIHGKIFNRTRLDLGGGEDHKLSSEMLLEKSGLGKLNKALLEKEFDAARYAILSSSGELPPTLQGVWTGTWSPPWQSDYTQNGNVPSAIASMLMANMPECMEAYLDYMESLLPHFRKNARILYGCRGIMVPSRTSSHGYNTHFNEEYIHLFWTPGAAWASHFFYDYYLYTGDKDFLIKRALPFMKESALFFEDFLYESPDGKYVFNPSYSPENTPTNSDSQACINATMDIALVKELLGNLIAACQELGIEEDGVRRWKKMLTKLPDYRINEDGTVAEWTTDKLADNHRHRHISHLYALYDALGEEIVNDQKLSDAFRKVIEKRMVPRRADGGGIMSFGLVQLGQAAASLGEAELAYEIVDMLANVYWRANMVSTHNPDSIFNVDICGGMPAVIIKMLVYSEPGKIILLPALPKEWPSGVIEGILCRGQVEVKRLKWDERRVELSLISQVPQNITISIPQGFKDVKIVKGDVDIVEKNEKKGECVMALEPGELVEVNFVR
jgi:alpha-L-fucosidase 2